MKKYLEDLQLKQHCLKSFEPTCVYKKIIEVFCSTSELEAYKHLKKSLGNYIDRSTLCKKNINIHYLNTVEENNDLSKSNNSMYEVIDLMNSNLLTDCLKHKFFKQDFTILIFLVLIIGNGGKKKVFFDIIIYILENYLRLRPTCLIPL